MSNAERTPRVSENLNQSESVSSASKDNVSRVNDAFNPTNVIQRQEDSRNGEATLQHYAQGLYFVQK